MASQTIIADCVNTNLILVRRNVDKNTIIIILELFTYITMPVSIKAIWEGHWKSLITGGPQKLNRIDLYNFYEEVIKTGGGYGPMGPTPMRQ